MYFIYMRLTVITWKIWYFLIVMLMGLMWIQVVAGDNSKINLRKEPTYGDHWKKPQYQKNQYQNVGWSCESVMGDYLFDTGLMQITGATQELWRPEEYISYHMVLKLLRYGTIKKLVGLYSSNGGDTFMVCGTLYFMQLRLFAVNAKYFTQEEMVIYHWSFLIWFTRFDLCAATMK